MAKGQPAPRAMQVEFRSRQLATQPNSGSDSKWAGHADHILCQVIQVTSLYKDIPKARGSEDGRGRIKVWERLMSHVLAGASVGSRKPLKAGGLGRV